jgi:hypothetical protein
MLNCTKESCRSVFLLWLQRLMSQFVGGTKIYVSFYISINICTVHICERESERKNIAQTDYFLGSHKHRKRFLSFNSHLNNLFLHYLMLQVALKWLWNLMFLFMKDAIIILALCNKPVSSASDRRCNILNYRPRQHTVLQGGTGHRKTRNVGHTRGMIATPWTCQISLRLCRLLSTSRRNRIIGCFKLQYLFVLLLYNILMW